MLYKGLYILTITCTLVHLKYELSSCWLEFMWKMFILFWYDIMIFYYTSPEICLYKSNTLDWYVIPRDKMKNITYGYANERAGLIIHAQFVWIKSLRHWLCSCACAVLTTACVSRRQAFPLARRSEIGRQLIKRLSIARFVWQNNWNTVCMWLSVINTKYTYVMKHFNASKPW